MQDETQVAPGSEPLDNEALRQMKDMDMPDDRDAAEQIWRHCADDLNAAVDRIEWLEARADALIAQIDQRIAEATSFPDIYR
jgi:hypothetical protein